MRTELEGLKGQEYFAAWAKLMQTIGADVLGYWDELKAWVGEDAYLEEVGVVGALVNRFDLPIKTTCTHLEAERRVHRAYYDLVVSAHKADDIKARGWQVEAARSAGQTYADLKAAERAIAKAAVAAREAAWLDVNFPLTDTALDRNGAMIRIGDKVKADWHGQERTLTVKELRIRAGKRVTVNDVRLIFEEEPQGTRDSCPAVLTTRLDGWYGE